MRKKTIGLYSPYLNILGGGERHILSIMEVLVQEEKYKPIVYWQSDLSQQIKQKLGITLPGLEFREPFHTKSFGQKWSELENIDILLYVTDGSYFFLPSKTIIFCMVPEKKLFHMNLMNKLKTFGSMFISNSRYTQKWLHDWGIPNQVVHPYVAPEFFTIGKKDMPRKKIILGVGRFFQSLHAKRQDKAIETFMQLQKSDPLFKNYTLVLAGGAEEADMAYVEKLRNITHETKSIQFVINPSFKELLTYYKDAKYFWHFAGFEKIEEETPHLVEHLGITPLEAMAAGVIPFCYNAGGPRETITHGENGFLFSTPSHLMELMHETEQNRKEQTSVIRNAMEYVTEHFSYPQFKLNVIETLVKES